jgi:hypothetical protein
MTHHGVSTRLALEVSVFAVVFALTVLWISRNRAGSVIRSAQRATRKAAKKRK